MLTNSPIRYAGRRLRNAAPPLRHAVAALAIVAFAAAAARAEMDFRPRPLDRLAECEFTVSAPPQGYSHIVMLAWPRLPAVEAEKIPATTAKFAQMFGSAILADVAIDPLTGRHRLNRVAIGHAVRDGDKVRVVTPKSEGITFIASQVLASGEKEFEKIRQIARYDTALLFETPAVVLRDGQHKLMAIRQFVWTSAAQGGLASVLWLIDNSDPTAPRLADQHVVQLPDRFVDDRVLSVDRSQFSLLGTPGPTAFAMVQLPQGEKIAVTPELAVLAAAPAYNEKNLPRLAQALSDAVAAER